MVDKEQLINDIFDLCSQDDFQESHKDLDLSVEPNNSRIRIQDDEQDYFLILSDTPYPTAKEIEHDDFRKIIALMRQNNAPTKLIKEMNKYLFKPEQQLKLF